jgi:formate-dependent nitrite reductase membrane component NrfD
MGRPENMRFAMGNPTAFIFYGSIFLSSLLLVSLLTAILQYAGYWEEWGALKKPLCALGLFLGLAVTWYSALFLSGAWGNGLWNNIFLPWLFFVSGYLVGDASIVLTYFVASKSRAIRKLLSLLKLDIPDYEARQFVELVEEASNATWTKPFLALLAITTVLYLATAAVTSPEALMKLITGDVGAVFWLLAVAAGTLIPLYVEFKVAPDFEKRGYYKLAARAIVISAALIIIGAIFVRYAIVIAGQL